MTPAERNEVLEEAADEAELGWITANYDVVGIADADVAMRLCEHIAAAIRALKEQEPRPAGWGEGGKGHE